MPEMLQRTARTTWCQRRRRTVPPPTDSTPSAWRCFPCSSCFLASVGPSGKLTDGMCCAQGCQVWPFRGQKKTSDNSKWKDSSEIFKLLSRVKHAYNATPTHLKFGWEATHRFLKNLASQNWSQFKMLRNSGYLILTTLYSVLCIHSFSFSLFLSLSLPLSLAVLLSSTDPILPIHPITCVRVVLENI